MKNLFVIIIISLIVSCGSTDNVVGIYYNGYGESLELKNDNTYCLVKRNGFLRTGQWKMFDNGQVLFYNWINTEDEKGHQEVTYKNETLWFSLDDYNSSFKK